MTPTQYLLAALVVAGEVLLFAVLVRVLQQVNCYHAQQMAAIAQLREVQTSLAAKLGALSGDIDAQVRAQAAALYDMLAVVEKASSQALYVARRVSGELAVREEKVDTALAERQTKVDTGRETIADDLESSRRRAEETVGEPGAAADAALRPDEAQ